MSTDDEKNVKQSNSHLSVNELSREELICKVKQLEAHVTQLKNIIAKTGAKKTSESKSKRTFDFSRYNVRHVALKMLYLGWDYHGFAVQEDTERTIETALFNALLKAKLIENRETSNYHRCGRTDKGVSAFSQVISIDLRSNLSEGVGVKVQNGVTRIPKADEQIEEINYPLIINRLLPAEMRVVAWAPVEGDFSARFDCQQRIYKYFFPKGQINIELMKEAGQRLIGPHDYRNFCKMDVAGGVVNFVRNISHLSVEVINDCDMKSSYQMCELTVSGKAFLWHQIRCIVSVLFLVGIGKEPPEIITELLDVDKHPKRPQYSMASDFPLVLFDCQFETLDWIYDQESHQYNIRDIQRTWGNHSIKAMMTYKMLMNLESIKANGAEGATKTDRGDNFLDWLSPNWHGKFYKRLLARDTCNSLEDKIESAAKRKKMTSAKADQS